MNIKDTLQVLLDTGFNQTDLAHAIGVKQAYISRITNGSYEIKNPSYAMVTAITTLCKKLKVKPIE